MKESLPALLWDWFHHLRQFCQIVLWYFLILWHMSVPTLYSSIIWFYVLKKYFYSLFREYMHLFIGKSKKTGYFLLWFNCKQKFCFIPWLKIGQSRHNDRSALVIDCIVKLLCNGVNSINDKCECWCWRHSAFYIRFVEISIFDIIF